MLTVCLRIRLKERATIFVAAPLLRAACTDDRGTPAGLRSVLLFHHDAIKLKLSSPLGGAPNEAYPYPARDRVSVSTAREIRSSPRADTTSRRTRRPYCESARQHCPAG